MVLDNYNNSFSSIIVGIQNVAQILDFTMVQKRGAERGAVRFNRPLKCGKDPKNDEKYRISRLET